ncbi:MULTISPECIES: hypothetical protein [unclassified Sulfuricurvum]|uniref:hypothetical protein n=1 Tax=unclassified Sulfuricurvum TaxID=2632390 RepID=UPI0002996A9E|nr:MULTISPECIES: hypothetical protein [unclassified Sulfuricurvum]AFV97213.1 hypothetical protein B649_04495 [Candidatus Sulfuricurvum sp. RIFRC-1]HBM34864.1 hypothetical protein [Sulfuricurvum sp.]
MKELNLFDLKLAFEQDIKMALYTLERYNVEANLALVACDDYDIDKVHLMDSVRQSDIIKKVNEHYISVLFTFVDHVGARRALDKLVNLYQEYDLKGSLIILKKGETIEGVCERLLEANHIIHRDPDNNIYCESDYALTQ